MFGRRSGVKASTKRIFQHAEVSLKFAPITCGWHHAPAGQASSKEDTFYEHLPNQDPSSYRRFQAGRVGRPNRSGPSPENPLRVARGSRLWHRPRRTPGLSRSHRPPECRVRGGDRGRPADLRATSKGGAPGGGGEGTPWGGHGSWGAPGRGKGSP